MKTVQIRVEGRVQGVYFREYTRRQAQSLGLKGWVRNMVDGSVETVVSGDDNTITTMITWLHSGSPRSAVTKVSIIDEQVEGDFSSFEILF